MKLLLLFVAVFGLSSATKHRDFLEDFDAILRLLPMDDYFDILNAHLIDPEVQTVISFLQGEEWSDFLNGISEKEEWQNIKNWIHGKELDIDYLILLVREIINVIELPSTSQDLGGFRAFVDALQNVTPYDELGVLIDEMINAGGDFAELIDNLRRPEVRALFEEIVADNTAQYAIEKLSSYGIDVERIRDGIYSFLGWNTLIEFL